MRRFRWTWQRVLILIVVIAGLIIGGGAIINALVQAIVEAGLLGLVLYTLAIGIPIVIMVAVVINAVRKKNRG